jgi:glycogen debranching enzyme
MADDCRERFHVMLHTPLLLRAPCRAASLLAAVIALGALGPACTGAGPTERPSTRRVAPRECLAPSPIASAHGDSLVEGADRATVRIEDRQACRRRYQLSTTGPLRDGQPQNPRSFVERADMPSVRTNHDLFDALHALAIDEVGEASVTRIRDDAFDEGRPVECPPGGCFETGRLWTYVWTRDTSFATHLALAALAPQRAKNSLEYKLSERRDGTGLEIVQDTGSGGSYPISTDRVVWALGAREVLHHLDGAERVAFEARAFEAVRNTIEHDRAVVFDPLDGLYTGETSFLDWREQTYPPWTATDTIHIGTSKALSTNVAHLGILELASELARARGDAVGAERYRGWAAALREAIARRFWLADRKMLAAFTPSFLDPAPSPRYDLLGAALAVLGGVLDEERARQVVAGYPMLPHGPPVVWPQQQDVVSYHNRAIWPFVTAYFARAARQVGNDEVVTRCVRSLMRGAALNLSHMENFELVSGRAEIMEQGAKAPVINSQRQLWSVAGYVSMVHDVIFGLETSHRGIRFRPFVPRQLRNTMFARADRLVLDGLSYRGRRVTAVVSLPPVDATTTGAYAVGSVRVDGRAVSGDFIPHSALAARSTVEIDLVDGSRARSPLRSIDDLRDRRTLYGPRPPNVVRVVAQPDTSYRVELDVGGERREEIALTVYRDGVAAAKLSGSTTTGIDRSVPPARVSPCYSVESEYLVSGNVSQRSRSQCHWTDDHVQMVPMGSSKTAMGAAAESGRDMQLPTFRARASGDHVLSLLASNGAGPINTGVTCAVRQVTVTEVPTGNMVASAPVFVPHSGGWNVQRESSFLRVPLIAGRTYRIRLHDGPAAVNMSAFRHFEHYTGGAGGAGGPMNRMDVSAARLMLRDRR